MNVTSEMRERGLAAWIAALDPDLRGGTIEAVAERGVNIALEAALGDVPEVTNAAYVAKLEQYALDADGYRCDACNLVFDVDEITFGEDCHLCKPCSGQMTEPERVLYVRADNAFRRATVAEIAKVQHQIPTNQ